MGEGENKTALVRSGPHAEGKRRLPVRGSGFRQLLLADAFAAVMSRAGLQERLQLPLAALHGKLAVLRGRGWSAADTQRYAASAVGAGWAGWTAGAAMATLAHELAMLSLGAVIGLLLPVTKLREPARQAERRRQHIVLALPDMLGKLMLLVGAGETVQRAVARCWNGQAGESERTVPKGVRRNRKTPDRPLQEEWGRMVRALENGESFAAAVESFSRRCAVQEVSMFATVMLLHYRKGGDQFALALRELSYSLWEKRKATARMRGEEASSKLVIPLAVIFGLLMIAVAAPAVLMMP